MAAKSDDDVAPEPRVAEDRPVSPARLLAELLLRRDPRVRDPLLDGLGLEHLMRDNTPGNIDRLERRLDELAKANPFEDDDGRF